MFIRNEAVLDNTHIERSDFRDWTTKQMMQKCNLY